MTETRPFPLLPLLGFALLTLAAYGVEGWIVASRALLENPELLAAAVTVDLTIGVPLLYYLLVVRGGRVPAFTVLPVFLLSLTGAGWLLPPEHHTYLGWIGWAALPAELSLAGVLGYKAYRQARRVSRSGERADFLESLRARLREMVPHRGASEAAAFEIAVLYYALFSWRAAPDVGEGETAYTYHRRNGYVGLMGAMAGVGMMELGVVHLLVERWSPTAAWVLTALSAYGVVWVLGLARAAVLRPILVTPETLHLRIGLQWTARIPLDRVASVGTAPRGLAGDTDDGYLHAAPLGDARIVLHLAEPMEVRGLYGRRRGGVRRIGIAVDDAPAFIARLQCGPDARAELD